MICENPNCHAQFNLRDRAQIETGCQHTNEIIVKSECPACGTRYYSFTGLWIASINPKANAPEVYPQPHPTNAS